MFTCRRTGRIIMAVSLAERAVERSRLKSAKLIRINPPWPAEWRGVIGGRVDPLLRLSYRRTHSLHMKALAFATFSAASLLVITGCSASRTAMGRAEFAHLRAQPEIAVVTHAPEAFSFLSGEDNLRLGLGAAAAGALTGGVGGFLVGRHAESLARTQGERLAAELRLEDPTPRVRDSLLDAVARQLQLRNVVPLQDRFSGDDLSAIAKRTGASIIWDFKTTDWRLSQAGVSSRYRLYYRVRSRLFRSGDDKVLWQGDCRYDRDDADATLEELTANQGKPLRARMDRAAEHCATTLLIQFLGHG
jgi:hypothetical protein